MGKENCWEFLKCGREPNGSKAKLLGVCPAATFKSADGFLDGDNGGRACAYITGTFCGGTVQGNHKEKEKKCAECDFYKQLRKEHGAAMSVFRFNEYVNKATT